MKLARIILIMVILSAICLLISEQAFARSRTLTTTLIITVRPIPEANLLPADPNADTLNELAINPSMRQPHIKQELRPDLNSSGQPVYTITDSL